MPPGRYFSCSTLNGRLYLHYVAGAMIYHSAEEVTRIFNPARDRRIETVEELDEVLRLSVTQPLPFGLLYLTEGLEEAARRRSKSRVLP